MFTQQQWHDDTLTRGRAISIAQLGQTLSESIGSVLVALLAIFDWRSLWIDYLCCLLHATPFLRYLTQRTRHQDGEGRSYAINHARKNSSLTAAMAAIRSLRDPVFWLP